ncbi:MAG: class I SAM-dependent methyltransferase [Gemmatimonadetes bacterium]|nr:class I SAM-dependent methyltransferase [Gemmatimonadota bacterium]
MAKWYDFDYERRMRRDLPFYRACAEEGGGPVLELGAGTGRVSAYLARAGFDVTAVDLSEAMLERAETRRAKLGEAGDRIRLVRQDMAELTVRGRFGTVLVPFHSFHHLYSTSRQLAALRAIRRRLTERGIAVFVLFRPDIPQYQDYDSRLVVSYERTDRSSGNKVVQRFRMQCEFPRQMMYIDYYWDEYRGRRRINRDHAPMRWRWFHRYEFEHLLARANLRPIRILGDYDSRPFDDRCEQMIFFAMRA